MAGTRSEAAARAWAQRSLGASDLVHVPHLSTPGWDFYVVSQPRLGHGGEVSVMSDGDKVLPAGRDNFVEVLRREGALDDPGAIPPAQLAELAIRMAEVRQARVLEDDSDFALEQLEPGARARFAPPAARKTDDGVELAFWTSGPEPSRVERWLVRIALDGTLTHEVERLG